RKAAEAFFSGPAAVGVATGQNFPDALAGGAHIGKKGGPVLLTPSTTLAGPTDAYLRANHAAIDIAFIYGGVNAVSSAVGAQIQADIA
ncbi:MAG: cell wall-binding repeat-containing protein, partial [Actinobacteria bacterium]